MLSFGCYNIIILKICRAKIFQKNLSKLHIKLLPQARAF
jgi:hypothetical protein